MRWTYLIPTGGPVLLWACLYGVSAAAQSFGYNPYNDYYTEMMLMRLGMMLIAPTRKGKGVSHTRQPPCRLR
ncbi:hypothetical protein SAMN05421688_1499 [Poseidonocella pacifica]|uniref:Uncharacterized protein n=1 Tax=Poseidonocella pacifica TaxID=871651 RepID=A0A1I0WL19_9RHOB|nr:hypothetical protein SAMN05421688_1499 [Poseidonocella pacifica]